MGQLTPAVSVRELVFRHPGAERPLGPASFSVAAGECVAIVGPNGAGKTSLLLALAGVLAVPAGRVTVVGLDPSDPRQRRQMPARVGVVFSDSDDQLIHPTLADDVAFGPYNLGLPEAEVRERVAEALRLVGLTGHEGRAPQRMSAGEKRRAALAGVLAVRPEVLLLDEPTVFLDPRGRRELLAILRGLAVTQLVATHDLEFVLDLCERVIILDGGRVAADGPAVRLLADEALMEAHGLEVPGRLRRSREG